MNAPSLARHCPQCKRYGEIKINLEGDNAFVLACPSCREPWGKIVSFTETFECCPVCQCRQFYTSKDFNQFLGCLIMVIGIVLAIPTYGLSLPVFALIDWLLFRKVPTMINCYKCGTEFRYLQTQKEFKPFMHHIGLKYDKYR